MLSQKHASVILDATTPPVTKDRVEHGEAASSGRSSPRQRFLIASARCFCQNQQPGLKIYGRIATLTVACCTSSHSGKTHKSSASLSKPTESAQLRKNEKLDFLGERMEVKVCVSRMLLDVAVLLFRCK